MSGYSHICCLPCWQQIILAKQVFQKPILFNLDKLAQISSICFLCFYILVKYI